jgi:hypothetical protein
VDNPHRRPVAPADNTRVPPDPVNLIRVYDFYLAATLVVGVARRWLLYWDVIALVVRFRGRWPKLTDRLLANHGVLLTRDVLRPLFAAVALTVVQFTCSRLVWPTARLPVPDVLTYWQLLIPITAAAVPMLLIDTYFLVRVGRFDRGSTEDYLDYAERWLTGWRSPAVRLVTLGYINPQRIVDAEVVKGLQGMGKMVSWASRWAAIQLTFRVAFGLTMWLVWAYNSRHWSLVICEAPS